MSNGIYEQDSAGQPTKRIVSLTQEEFDDLHKKVTETHEFISKFAAMLEGIGKNPMLRTMAKSYGMKL